jgi:hypothetical protein
MQTWLKLIGMRVLEDSCTISALLPVAAMILLELNLPSISLLSSMNKLYARKNASYQTWR